MKISGLWLKEWCPHVLTAKSLAEKLTMAGLEVEAILPAAGNFSQVVVAEVLETAPHPQADKLKLCKVSTGEGKILPIVCGASNVRTGLKVALAQLGAELPQNLTIKASQIRGELSEGMLCSATELGLSQSSNGILELDENAPLGMNLRDYLNLEDEIFEISLTPNRGDCFSVLGLARELSMLSDGKIKDLVQPFIPIESDKKKNIVIEDFSACPHYYGRFISGINLKAKTPLWMRERLRRAGIRSIHPAVDVTNYVMLELGQPLHAFDADKITGDLCIRFARPAEALQLLDEQEVVLDEKVLVIADEKNALAMAGVMGGLSSAVSEGTENIFLECAYFDPKIVSQGARGYKIFTDAAMRFERGVDFKLQTLALDYATALLLDIVGGQAGPSLGAADERFLPQRPAILFNPECVEALTAVRVEKKAMEKILQGLRMEVLSQAEPWQVKPPSFRFDLQYEADLVEEVVRIYGYDRIPIEALHLPLRRGSVPDLDRLQQRAGEVLLGRAYQEIISYSFVEAKQQEKFYPQISPLLLLNPLSPELAALRLGLWPGLIRAMLHNLHRQHSTVKFFEMGRIFNQDDAKFCLETPVLAGLLTGEVGTLNWSEEKRPLDFYDLKGDIEALFSALALSSPQFLEAKHPALHPGKSAQIYWEEKAIGWCGVLHPSLAERFELSQDVMLFELTVSDLALGKKPAYQPISKFPSIRRDLSFIVESAVCFHELDACIRELVPNNWLKSISIFDVYAGKPIELGKKSLALALVFQNEERTFVDAEINLMIDAILKKLRERFFITLRN